MTSISVVVCTHLRNRLPQLRLALESLSRQSTRPTEVIVVIDGDPSLTADVRAIGHVDEVITRSSCGGLSAARNSGIAVAGGELVAFLDDDAVADEKWLEVLVHSLESDPGSLGSGGRSVPNWETRRPAWWPEEFLWVVGCTYPGLGTASRPVRNVFGGCACIRRAVFEQVGGYSLELGRTLGRQSGGEEAEFCVRAQRALGGHFRYEPGALIYHTVPAERTTHRYFLRRCLAEGRSKAVVRFIAGANSLGIEMSYLSTTIPASLGRALVGVARRRRGSAGSLVATLTGVGATVGGYAMARTRLAAKRHRGADAPPAIAAPQALTASDSETLGRSR